MQRSMFFRQTVKKIIKFQLTTYLPRYLLVNVGSGSDNLYVLFVEGDSCGTSLRREF